MNKETELILHELKYIKQELIELKNEIRQIKKNTQKMDDHIDFVDSVYEKVKAPFHFICNKVETISKTNLLE